ADRVAEQVMRMPATTVSRACERGGTCSECRETSANPELENLSTKRIEATDTDQLAAPAIVHDVLASPGEPLDTQTRHFFEPRFGRDFGTVRVHTDSKAALSARSINAEAYTVGCDVVFGAGQYAPGTTKGRGLLAHELAHVVQQSGSPALEQGEITADRDGRVRRAVTDFWYFEPSDTT